MRFNSETKFFLYAFLTEISYLLFYPIRFLAVKLGVENLYLKDNLIFLLTIINILLLTFFYIKTFGLILKKTAFKTIFLTSLIFNISLLFLWNFSTDDLYTYIGRSRMISFYGANPYINRFDEFSGDVLYPLVKTYWSSELSVHGPMFSLFGSVLSGIAGENLVANVFTFKIAFVILNILSGVLVYKIRNNIQADFLYAWNPHIRF